MKRNELLTYKEKTQSSRTPPAITFNKALPNTEKSFLNVFTFKDQPIIEFRRN